MNQCRLIYKSTSTEEVMSNEDLLQLVKKAVENNQREGISGMLLLSGTRFLQVLEGPGSSVNALFQRISHDDRHHTIELICFEPAADTYFEDWNMRLVDLYDLPMEQRSLFMKKYQHDDGIVRIPDRLNEVIALLLDAKAICLNQPWAG